ncbi:26S proteasome non-ATPase regulatory subunit 4-like [Sycon ciliatum]|uniref:26S proteasome non-ATPase regulatory subunit 4-like n=1 Tax=Sycon ciliatum TaxID=27933 RepID=UPI0020AB70E9|eukprot:scpid54897/ scgid33486/ 26S proteasome non-ATPase regulatory subunit 4; 26S proteasome regulatory subunit RPN10
MPEATMICIDDSDWMRNGDFLPTRLQAQEDAVNVICRAKQQESPENTFGVSTFTRGKVLVTLTTTLGNIITRLHQVEPTGAIDFVVGVRIAHLALRHRKVKNAKMRIVAFVGSPVKQDDAELKKLAMRLKKENVSIDIVNFGEIEENSGKLESFIKYVNGGKAEATCHLVTIPASANQLSDALMTSPIIGASGNYSGGGSSGGGGAHGDFDFGVDPSADPELAMALRVSMEEERSRRQAEQRTTGEGSAEATTASTAPTETTAAAPTGGNEQLAQRVGGDAGAEFGMTEDEELMLALQMSMENQSGGGGEGTTGTTSTSESADAAWARELLVEEAVAMADGDEPMDDDDADIAEALNDPDVLRSVLSSLPGVDMESDTVQQVLSETAAQREASKKDGEEDDDSDDDL